MQHSLTTKNDQNDVPVAAATAESKPSYYVDFSTIYFIWFSRDRSSFMPIRHRIAIENLRKAKNSDELKLMLVYAERLLDQPAQEKLVNFCVLHQIKLIEVHSLEAGCSDCPVESELFQNLLLELYDPNGNAAAASDICRVLSDTILQGNTYVDCDNIKELDAPLLKSHMIAQIDESVKPGHILGNVQLEDEITHVNNDILAFVRRADTHVTKAEIRSGFCVVQKEILNAYRNPNKLFSKNPQKFSSIIKSFSNKSEHKHQCEQDVSFKTVFELRGLFKHHLSMRNYFTNESEIYPSATAYVLIYNAVQHMNEIAKCSELNGIEKLMQHHLDQYHEEEKKGGELIYPIALRMLSDYIENILKFSVILFSGPHALLKAVKADGRDHAQLHSLQYYSLANVFNQSPDQCALYTTQAIIDATAKNELSWVDRYAEKYRSREARQIQSNVLFQYHAQTLYKGKRPPTPELHMAIEADVPEESSYIEKLKLA